MLAKGRFSSVELPQVLDVVRPIRPRRLSTFRTRKRGLTCGYGKNDSDKRSRFTLRLIPELLQDVKGVGIISVVVVVNLVRLSKKVSEREI